MIFRARWSLLPTIIASAGLVGTNVAGSLPAFAQATTPPAPPGASAPAVTEAGDPPARVGWVANLSGSVSFHSAGQNAWTTATQNYPFATGDAIWTEPQAAASIMIDASRLALSGGTELTAQEIDQSTLTAALSQGEIFLNLVSLENGQSVVIETPRGTVQITSDGQYEIYAGDSSTPTYVTAVTGSLQFTGLGQDTPQTVGAQQTLAVSGSNPVQSQLGAMQQDQFLTAMLQQIAPPPPPSSTAAPAVVAQMTGASVLSQYGSWQAEPSVGTVWFPQVASSWVPYRDGRWAYIQPWGWTWVDNAPWGFAPFHYGRWAEYGGRWGWVPAPAVDPGYNYATYQPVYAPALVTFLGAAAGALTAAAFASGAIGWAPLAPREAYYPPYPVSPRYFGAYNRPYVQNYNQFYQRNVTIVNNRVSYRNAEIINSAPGAGPGGFINRQGATFVPRDAMLQSHPIAAVARPLPQGAQIQSFRPGDPAQLPRPTAATWGVTPAMAAREHLAPGPGGAPRAAAPGPAIRPLPMGPGQHAAPPLVAHGAVAPNFRGAGGGTMPGAALHGPGAVTTRGLPPLPQAAGHNTGPQPQVRPAAPQAQEHGPAAGFAGHPQNHPVPGAPAPHNGALQPPPRVETPRVEAPRVQAPRVEAPRVEAPRVQAPRVEAPRVEAPRVEAPRVEAPRVQAPRVEAPRVQAPRVEAPRPAPRMEAPRMEAPRMEAPRMETPRAAPPRPAPHEAPRGNPQKPPQH